MLFVEPQTPLLVADADGEGFGEGAAVAVEAGAAVNSAPPTTTTASENVGSTYFTVVNSRAHVLSVDKVIPFHGAKKSTA